MPRPLIPDGTYEKLKIIGTRLEKNATTGDPVVVVSLMEPDADEGDENAPILSDFLQTSNAAWDFITAKRLASYGWDAYANSFALSYFANPANDLIGTLVGPVVVKSETYNNKSRPKVYRVGDEQFGSGLGDDEAKKAEKDFQARMRMRTGSGPVPVSTGHDTGLEQEIFGN